MGPRTMPNYYVVYSIRNKHGSGFGRSTLISDREISSFDQITQIEADLLKSVQEQHPDDGYEKLFLVNWRELAPPRS